MKEYHLSLIALVLAACSPVFWGCSGSKTSASKDVEWERVEGAGLSFMAQKADGFHLIVDESIPGAVLVDGDGLRRDTVLRVFATGPRPLEKLPGILAKQPGWKTCETCRLREIGPARKGWSRYVLVPDGTYADSINAMMAESPVPSTCSGWGIGNSGMRYFEINDSQPDKVLFVEIGQEVPLFDPNSISFSNK